MNEPPDKPPDKPFDHSKWSFWLVAFVIGWMLIMAMQFEITCLMWSDLKKCDTQGKFAELLDTILASALAFAAGRSTK